VNARVATLALVLIARSAGGEVLGGKPAAADSSTAIDSWLACRDLKPQPASCASHRSAAVALLREDLRALGGSGNFAPLPILLGVMARSPEPELRAAAADATGMLGPRATETPALAAAFNDPVPAVRQSARLALGASADPAAQALAGRAVHAERWKSLAPEKAPDTAKLKVAPYAGATALRFATDVANGRALFVTEDPPEKVAAFYDAKAKRKAMSLEEFAAAYSESQDAPEEEEASDDSGDDSGGQMPTEDQMEQAMAMLDQMNAAMESGKSMEEAAVEMSGASTKAESAASEYANETIFGAPRVIVLEEGTFFGKTRPSRYVVVFRDLTLGKTGIALHGPPVI
jgi:hypothetical protein